MTLQEIIGEGDSASAVMFWTHLYLGETQYNEVRAMQMLHRINKITAIVKVTDDMIGTLVEICWKNHHLQVYSTHLRALAAGKFAAAIAEWQEKHKG